jgi:hypothetical protein
MSGSRQSVIVSREYKPAPDDCARALGLLLQTSFNSQTSKGGSDDLTADSTKECTTRQAKKGKENADVHGN